MLINTESGATYEVKDGICTKTEREGNTHIPFKVWKMIALPADARSLSDILALPDSPVTVGLRMYIAGRNVWWVSTQVVSIKDDESNE